MAKDEIYVFYGSQTGQAEAIAENIHEATDGHGTKSTLVSLRKAEEVFKIISEKTVTAVFVCSTTGDGELPGVARKFVRMLNRKTLDRTHLSKLHYALLGLGDTNYSTFCGGPKILEKALKKLGATSYYPTGYADDGTDLEMVVEPWIEGLWPALSSHLKHRKTALDCSSFEETDIAAQLESKVTLTPTNQPSKEIFKRPVASKNDANDARDDDYANNGAGNHGNTLTTDHDAAEVPLSNKGINVELDHSDEIAKSTDIKNIIQQSKVVHGSPGNFDKPATLIFNAESPLKELSSNTEGTLPPLMQPYITYETVTLEQAAEPSNKPHLVPYPIALDDEFYYATIESVDRITADDAVKASYCVTLNIPDDFSYQPGDSFGIIVQNTDLEVDWLIQRLNLESDCEKTISLKIDPETKKKNAKLPKFLPQITTVRYILKHCLEIRSVPKRTFLRALVECTTDESDRNVLRQLCRKETMDDFIKYLREPNLNILDLLASLPSCQPSFQILLEHLPRLKSRLYSAASSLSVHPGKVKFIFNLIDFQPIQGRMYPRKGLCTGYLTSIVSGLLEQSLSTLTIFKTKNTSFRLPSKIEAPIVMVGPGTGVAPFVGFLEEIGSRSGAARPETWLFYGCRHKNRDYLFQSQLEGFSSDGTLCHLVVSFSRDGNSLDGTPRYVQDNMKIHSNEIRELLLRQNAVFYVCGDARNMAKDVRATVTEILAEELGNDASLEVVKNLIKDGCYKEDVWI